MKSLQVELGDRRYPVMIGTNLLMHSGRILARLGFDTPPIVVSNARVMRLHGKALLSSLQDVFGPVTVICIGDGERFKNQTTLAKIYDGFLRVRAGRHSWVLAFGGGVVGDIAGFAAATFLRGIPWVGVPTTLVAQVDSSVGGKVGINLAQGKNLIGAFHQPTAVLADTAALRTLPVRELAAGLFEIIKCGAIRSEPLLAYLERRLDAVMNCELAAVERVVVDAVRVKADLVAGDEREEGLRMVLNYGHTLGHALEAATDYRRFKHGEAVAWGMVAAAGLGCAVAGFSRQEEQRLVRLIHRIERLPTLRGISCARVWEALRRDKKSHGERIRMILLPRIGRTEMVDHLDPSQLRHFIADFLKTADKHRPRSEIKSKERERR
jgi:3-dehydroquinate synthase